MQDSRGSNVPPFQVSLARVLCDNAEDIRTIQPLAFQVYTYDQSRPAIFVKQLFLRHQMFSTGVWLVTAATFQASTWHSGHRDLTRKPVWGNSKRQKTNALSTTQGNLCGHLTKRFLTFRHTISIYVQCILSNGFSGSYFCTIAVYQDNTWNSGTYLRTY